MRADAHYKTFAAYNRWANARLYGAVSALSDTDFIRDQGMFFKSIQGTLNHLVVADRIWLRRITGEGPAHGELDEIPYPVFPDLFQARQEEDQRIISLMNRLSEEDYSQIITYQNSKGESWPDPLFSLLAHFFNHQTHHRGQVHNVLSQMGRKPPALDLIFYRREQEKKVG
ncbi:MAG: DinB family protein [Alphaproteobacteria bacterium]|nr:DinB family protein [Alphaproteobacteria bacterium]